MRRHSHTEIADRLFSIMQLHFESDSANRCTGVEGFDDMICKFTESFSKSPETVKGEAGSLQTSTRAAAAGPTTVCTLPGVLALDVEREPCLPSHVVL